MWSAVCPAKPCVALASAPASIKAFRACTLPAEAATIRGVKPSGPCNVVNHSTTKRAEAKEKRTRVEKKASLVNHSLATCAHLLEVDSLVALSGHWTSSSILIFSFSSHITFTPHQQNNLLISPCLPRQRQRPPVSAQRLRSRPTLHM